MRRLRTRGRALVSNDVSHAPDFVTHRADRLTDEVLYLGDLRANHAEFIIHQPPRKFRADCYILHDPGRGSRTGGCIVGLGSRRIRASPFHCEGCREAGWLLQRPPVLLFRFVIPMAGPKWNREPGWLNSFISSNSPRRILWDCAWKRCREAFRHIHPRKVFPFIGA